MAKVQNYGIKFPFETNSSEGRLLDTDLSKASMVRSQLLHVLFTPVGQRLRKPLFGTRLIQFIFNPNDGETYSDILTEIRSTIKNWVPDCSLDDLEIGETDNGLGLVAKITYTVKEDNGTSSTYQFEASL